MSLQLPRFELLDHRWVFDLLDSPPLGPASLLLSLGACVLGPVVVARAAKSAGRAPNFAGWLLGPSVGVAIAALGFVLTAMWRLERIATYATDYPMLRAHTAMWPMMEGAVPLILSLGLGGVVLGLASLSRGARQQRFAARLGLTGALLLTASMLGAAHRESLFYWILLRWHDPGPNAELAWVELQNLWVIKVWLLRYAALLTLLLGLTSWRRPLPAARRAFGLSLLITLALAASIATADRLHRVSAEGSPWAEPAVVPVQAGGVVYEEPWVPYPHRVGGYGALEVRLGETSEALPSAGGQRER